MLELKSGGESENSIYKLCAEWALEIFRVQDTQIWVIIDILHQGEVTVGLFDHGSSLCTTAFSLDSNWPLLVWLILGIAFTPLFDLGYDHSVSELGHGHYVKSDLPTLGNIQIHFMPFISESIHGQGTVIWLGTVGPDALFDKFTRFLNLQYEDPLIIKTHWVDVNSVLSKGTILSFLAAKGMQGIPQLVAEEQVQTSNGYYDGTTYLHAKLRMCTVNECMHAKLS